MALAFPSVSVRKLLPGKKSSVPATGKRSIFQRSKPKTDLTTETAQPVLEPDQIVVPQAQDNSGWYRLGISEFANWGNVYTKRISTLSFRLYAPMVCVGLFAGYHLLIGAASQFLPEVADLPHIPVSLNLDPMPPEWIAGNYAVDRRTYFDLGGGLQGDDALAWMASYRPSPVGMTTADLSALAAAIRADLAKYGTTAKWQAVGKLNTAPAFSTPGKAISSYGDRLKDGIVLVVNDSSAVFPVVAQVDGEWSVTLFKGNACRTLLGPVAAGCTDVRAKGGEISKEARSVLSMIDPRRA